jgi:outer membrane protein TolC
LPSDAPLAINLATALRLADARPLVIRAAEATVISEIGRLQRAKSLWLPTITTGFAYTHHDGGIQSTTTAVFARNSRNEILLGAGGRVSFAFSEAIYAPLVAQQIVAARQLDVQSARNDALLEVAEAYFQVQEARGRVSGLQDIIEKARLLVDRIDKLAAGLAPSIESERARTTLAEFELALADARREWRQSSARLNQVLRLNPSAVVEPLEPPQLQVTLIAATQSVDDLIPIALTSRPELGSHQAIVQATLAAMKRERMRPLIPSLLLEGVAVPGLGLAGGLYAAGVGGSINHIAARGDLNLQLVWEFENLGYGNRGRQTVARGDRMRAIIELFRVQDLVAAEVTRAHADMEATATQISKAEAAFVAATRLFDGNFKGLGETVRLGETLQLVSRPQEVVSAIQQLERSYTRYFAAVNGYNRAQFRLYRSMGYPSQGLACGDAFGTQVPIDTSRPAGMPQIPQ